MPSAPGAGDAVSVAIRPSRVERLDIRGLRYQVRHWGPEDAPRLVMVHGWMDVSASFQFLVDAFARDWHVVSPDWRGFGGTDWAPHGYWFPDYVADLDALLDRCSPGEPVRLVGHSLGGNVVMQYAGVCPQRVRRVVSLEGFGIKQGKPEDILSRYHGWMEGLRSPPSFRPFASRDAVAQRIQKNARHLPLARARFLADHWALEGDDGQWRLRSDPAHKLPFPTVYRLEEALAVWRRIEVPVLWVIGTESSGWGWVSEGEVERRRAVMSDCRLLTLHHAGHMLHLDQPEALAELIEPFLAD